MGTLVRIDSAKLVPSVLKKVAEEIVGGGVVLYPTETIYGLGCDALNARAVARLFEIKMRPEVKPMLLLVDGTKMLKRLVLELPDGAEQLMKKYWPGPLTILFKAAAIIPEMLTAGTGKIGVRMPGSDFCLRMVEAAKTPIVSTSANISGEAAPADVQTLRETFLGKVDLFVDSGDLPSSPPSTIVDVSENRVSLIREGAIPWSQIRDLVGA